jgi:hypothetical protein
MAARPSLYMNWTDGAADKVTEPSSGQKSSGWLGGEAPPFDFLNWLFWLSDQWIQYLDGQINNASAVVLTTTGNVSNTSNQLASLASTTNLAVGQVIAGTNIPVGTQVVSISGSTVTMSRAATGTLVGGTVTFSNRFALGSSVQLQVDQLDEAVTSHLGAWSNGAVAATSLITITEASDGAVYECTTDSAAFNCQLPNPTSFKNMKFTIVDKTGNFNTNAVTLVRFSSEKIDNLAANLVLEANFGRYTVFCDGTDFFVS